MLTEDEEMGRLDLDYSSDDWDALSDDARAEMARLRETNDDLLAALDYIVNDAKPGEDARLTVDGYNRACAAIAKARGES